MSTLSFDKPVLLVGAGPLTREDFEDATRFCGAVVAVDGGYDPLTAWGEVPAAVIGDMDSTTAAVPETVTRVVVDEQDSTDLEKALRAVDAPLCLGIGFLDGRLDHTLAAMHALVVSETPTILIGTEDIVFAAPPEWRAEVPVGTRVSFYPVRRVPALGSKGLRWPIDGLLMEGARQIGVSNEAASSGIAAWFAERGAVTILPRSCLGAAIDSLT
jgi:thiamine pyrophosphokinase